MPPDLQVEMQAADGANQVGNTVLHSLKLSLGGGKTTIGGRGGSKIGKLIGGKKKKPKSTLLDPLYPHHLPYNSVYTAFCTRRYENHTSLPPQAPILFTHMSGAQEGSMDAESLGNVTTLLNDLEGRVHFEHHRAWSSENGVKWKILWR